MAALRAGQTLKKTAVVEKPAGGAPSGPPTGLSRLLSTALASRRTNVVDDAHDDDANASGSRSRADSWDTFD
jgi:hypothetical protein